MNSYKQNKKAAIKKAVSVAVMGTVCLTAALSVAALTRTVTVTDGDTTVTMNTMNTDTEQLLAQAEISLGEDDKLVRTDDGMEDVNISILRAFSVDESDKEESMVIMQNEAPAFGEVEGQGSDVEINIQNWVGIELDVRGKEMKKDVPAGTVEEALAYLNIELGKNDDIDVKIDSPVEDGMKITITEVKYKKVTRTKTIDYKVIYKDTDKLYSGESEVETEGSEGERTIVKKIKYVNGEKVSEEEISNEVTVKAVDKVVLNGTAERVSQVDTDSSKVEVDESLNTITDKYGNTLYYTDVHTGSSTAYTAPDGALTATGRPARYGVVAVDPSIIPYGSILYIVSDDGIVYGYAVAGDTGGFIYNGTGTIVDLYFDTMSDCCSYGRRSVHVYVLDGVSEDATYNN